MKKLSYEISAGVFLKRNIVTCNVVLGWYYFQRWYWWLENESWQRKYRSV